ncbi:putative Ig domain-containing protein [Okeanomitos corallinicola TIOX110]|uniref:Ig domain-containing protein n=1 Tax=Okeanomitos corallinicola TIOX110 TaxID=3133117 RepID=A0ABZ2V2S9_9CYAN
MPKFDVFTITVEDVNNDNNAPTVENEIPNQTATEDTTFNFIIPENTFADVDAGDVLSYSATLANGNPLPSWLSFDAATRTFSGTPANENVGNFNVQVIATDSQGATVNDVFTITVEDVNNDNNAPTVENEIPNQTATEDTTFNFIIPENTFSDVDAGDVLSYSATLANGNQLLFVQIQITFVQKLK